MIISSAPLRVSFFGGGSDYPDYFEKNTGAVLSTAINKRIFVSVHRTNSISRARYILTYSKIEEVDKIEKFSIQQCGVSCSIWTSISGWRSQLSVNCQPDQAWDLHLLSWWLFLRHSTG